MSRLTLTLLVSACALLLFVPGDAFAAEKAPRKHKSQVVSAPSKAGVYTFRVRARAGHRIVRASIRSGRVTQRIGLRRVRTAVRRGRLHARLKPRVRAATARPDAPRRVRLELVSVKRSRVAASSGCELGAFGKGNWPGACWRPYSDSSPFNRRLGSRPRLHPRSSSIVRRVTGFGSPQNLVAGGKGDDWGHPTYYARSSDPVYEIECLESWGRCEVEGARVRIPRQARAASADDGHMTVVDQASGWEYDFWQARRLPANGGKLKISWGGRTHIKGDGLESGATAAGFGNLAGIVRAQEMAAGQIDHALFMVIDCDSGDHVYPAMQSARSCSSIGQSNRNAPPLGSRFMLDMSSRQIEALDVPRYKKTLLHAMADYGLYFGDTGGGSWGIQFESSATYTSFGFADPLTSFGRKTGMPTWDGNHVFDLKTGVDWRRNLRVVDPCEAKGTC